MRTEGDKRWGWGIQVVLALCGSALAISCVPPPVAPTEMKRLSVTGAGSALERVTAEDVTEEHPSISPDGQTLLFEVRVYGDQVRPKQQTLVAVNPNTRAQRTLYTSTNSLADHPAWLPDGSSYVYASNSPGQWSLVRALTSSPNAAVNVIASGEIAPDASWPTVSPDGKRIAFSMSVRGTPQIAVIGTDGSRLTLLGEGASPSWSPDGTRLAFSRVVNRNTHLFFVNPDTGTGLVQLTSGNWDNSTPSFSPDGRYIVFSTNRGAPSEFSKRVRNLYIIDIAGTNLTQLTDGDTLATEPCWGKDNWIYFASNQSGNFDIWRLRPSGPFASLGLTAPAPPPPLLPMAAPPPPPPPAPAAAAPAPAVEPPPAKATKTTKKASTAKAPKGAPAKPGGCTKDTECKGDRVCLNGECVDAK
jgi:TolB protein